MCRQLAHILLICLSTGNTVDSVALATPADMFLTTILRSIGNTTTNYLQQFASELEGFRRKTAAKTARTATAVCVRNAAQS